MSVEDSTHDKRALLKIGEVSHTETSQVRTLGPPWNWIALVFIHAPWRWLALGMLSAVFGRRFLRIFGVCSRRLRTPFRACSGF